MEVFIKIHVTVGRGRPRKLGRVTILTSNLSSFFTVRRMTSCTDWHNQNQMKQHN